MDETFAACVNTIPIKNRAQEIALEDPIGHNPKPFVAT